MTTKTFSTMQNVGSAKYVVNFHDGVKTHSDSSPFFDTRIFKSKKARDRFTRGLLRAGYQQQ